MSQPAEGVKALKFPDRFLWGTSTSTTQIEGHIQNEWTDFVARDGQTCRIACDNYHRYAEDIKWMSKIGVNSYRMGVEWSRLQSEPNGPLHALELARYIDQLDLLNAAGIVPMVVLHHFSNPPWVNAKGAWTNPATVPLFVDFVCKLVAALRNHVRLWNTFNEPDTYACCGYLIGEFPPLKKFRLGAFKAVVLHMAEAHLEACRIIRESGSSLGPVEVGFSKNWTWFQAHRKFLPWDIMLASFVHGRLNEYILHCFLGGERKNASTFLGINYYGRIRFRHLQPLVPTFGFTFEELAELGVECDDMLERHPSGLETAVRDMSAAYNLPIYLTEHGSSSGDEAFRALDLKRNLAALHRAIAAGADVRGFYYWSLLDNFEWQFGYSKKFGLLSVDFTQPALTRKMKPLAEIYRKVCQENALRA